MHNSSLLKNLYCLKWLYGDLGSCSHCQKQSNRLKSYKHPPVLSLGIGNINICQIIAQSVRFDCPLFRSL